MVPEISTATDRFLCHLWPFFAFIPPKNPKNKNFTKLKKAPGDIIILDKCLDTPPLPSDSPKNGKKKHLEISSFYTSVPKIMIIGYTVPEIWHMVDVIVIFHFGLYFTLSPP